MNSTANQVGQSAKTLAQQIAKQMAQEPLEILKDAKEKTAGEVLSPSPQTPEPGNDDQKKIIQQQGELNDHLKSGRRMEALNRELDDIHKQKVFAELQKKISEGEAIALEEYPDLSMEQKQVLKAQMEAVKKQIEFQKAQSAGWLPEPAAKKGRQLFNFGKKQSVKNEQTRVEKPVPPSG